MPCIFHKWGGCVAGSSCLFSHSSVKPQKEACKRNCKFGHKCALAHVLPGQSMAMDRKNKKAPRATASAASRGTIPQLLHSRDLMTVDSGDSWGELAERKENVHTTSFEGDIIFDLELECPPHVHLPSSRDRPDLMQVKNLNISARCIFPSSLGKFNYPRLSLVNADAHTDIDLRLPPDKPPPETRENSHTISFKRDVPLDVELKHPPHVHLPSDQYMKSRYGPPERFKIPIPSRKTRSPDDLEDGQTLLKYMIRDKLRSRRRVLTSGSTNGSRPSPTISGASDPFTPGIHYL